MKYIIWCMDTKTEESWRHVDAYEERIIKYSSKKRVEEEVARLNQNYAHTFYVFWYEEA